MNQIFSRVTAAAVSATLLLGAAGCTLFAPKTEAYAGNVKEDDRAVMTVNGDAVSVNEYVNDYLFYKSYLEQVYSQQGVDAASLWQNELIAKNAASQVQQMTHDQIVFERILPEKMKEAGLELTEEDEKSLAESKQADDKGEGFRAWLEAIGMSESRYDDLIRADKMLGKLKEYYFGENGTLTPAAEDLQKEFNANYYHVKHILIASGDGAEDKAKEITTRAKNGEDFDALMKEFNTDSGEPAEGYTFTHGKMVEAFENATKALGENEISEPVQTNYGYHVILRLPLDDTGFESVREDVVQKLAGTTFTEMEQQWIDAVEVKTEKLYDEITPDTLNDYLIETEATPAKSDAESSAK